MIKYYDITESELESKEFESGSLYYCSDSGNVYLDSEKESSRKKMNNEIIVLGTESNRLGILAPLPGKLYCVLETGSMYLYNSSWVKLGSKELLIFDNILVENGTLTIQDNRIMQEYTGIFVPDLSVIDLVSYVTVTCSNGSAIIKLTSSYPIPGSLKINV